MVGEDGLDGGSLVVSIMAIDERCLRWCVNVRASLRVLVRKVALERMCIGELGVGWRSGWLSESQMDYQLIAMIRGPRGDGSGGGRGGRRGGVRSRGRGRGRGCRGGGEARGYIFWMSSHVLRASMCLIRAGREMAAASRILLVLLHAQRGNRVCIIPVEE